MLINEDRIYFNLLNKTVQFQIECKFIDISLILCDIADVKKEIINV